MRSLQARLALGLSISLLLAFAVLWLLLSHAVRHLTEDNIASRLGHDSETILTAVSFDADGKPSLNMERIDPIYQRPFSGHYFRIDSGPSVLRSRSLWDQELSTALHAPGENAVFRAVGPQRKPLLVRISTYSKQGHRLSIAVAEDLSPLEVNLALFQRHFALVAITIFAGLIGLQTVIVTPGLHPLDRIRKEVRALERSGLHRLDTDVPTEVSPLVVEINRLIEILDKRLHRARHAMGDLAHALKKPLTLLCQLQHDQDLAALPEIQRTLKSHTTAMQQQIDRVLRRARIAGSGPALSHFSAGDELPILLDALRKMHGGKELEFELDVAPDLRLAVDREDLLELLGNLLDNACKWAGRQIRVSIRATTDETRIVVEDDGAGANSEALTTLTRRGTRLDEAVAGHGLGLGIVQDIIDDYAGNLEFGRSERLGGFQVIVTLPLGQPTLSAE